LDATASIHPTRRGASWPVGWCLCLCAASASVHPSIRPSHLVTELVGAGSSIRTRAAVLVSTAPSALRNRRLCRRPCTLVVLVSILLLPSALRPSGPLALWLSGSLALRLSSSPALSPSPQILRAPSSSFSWQLDWDDKKNTGRPSPRTYSRYPRVRTNTMGFWLGTVFFAALEVLGMFLVKSLIGTRQGRRHELLGQLLVATSVICCWLLWVIVYMGQMKVCLRYGCLSPAGNPASLRLARPAASEHPPPRPARCLRAPTTSTSSWQSHQTRQH